MFDPTIGRWQTKDPKSFDAGDTNLYRFVGNHPSYGTDPSGLEDSGRVSVNKDASQAEIEIALHSEVIEALADLIEAQILLEIQIASMKNDNMHANLESIGLDAGRFSSQGLTFMNDVAVSYDRFHAKKASEERERLEAIERRENLEWLKQRPIQVVGLGRNGSTPTISGNIDPEVKAQRENSREFLLTTRVSVHQHQ